MYAIIAQGGGFYGSAFFTTSLSFENLKSRLKNEASYNSGGKTISLHYLPDTNMLITPWSGKPQPNPVVLLDSGHKHADINALKSVKSTLENRNLNNV